LVTYPTFAPAGSSGTGPVVAALGSPVGFTFAAWGPSGSADAGNRGTVRVTTTDPAVVPIDYTFTGADAGVKRFDLTLVTPGRHTVTVTDAATGMASATYDVMVAGAGLGPDGGLTLVGTDGAETFTVAVVGGSLVVVGPLDATATFPLASVNRVEVQTFGGDDTVNFGVGVPGAAPRRPPPTSSSRPGRATAGGTP
jgi:hypothetical protein